MTHHARACRNFSGAFTLAEVLITLGIIGIVATLTLPDLIQNHRNHVVETRLKQFYSTINQAIALAEIDYGARENWFSRDDVDTDKNGNPIKGRNKNEKWMNKYLAPYMKNVKVESSDEEPYAKMYLSNGSVFYFSAVNYSDFALYTGDPVKCNKRKNVVAACRFYFSYGPLSSMMRGRNVEPYNYGWDGTKESLERYCINNETGPSGGEGGAVYCTQLIQYNGWKIPENYPYKVSY